MIQESSYIKDRKFENENILLLVSDYIQSYCKDSKREKIIVKIVQSMQFLPHKEGHFSALFDNGKLIISLSTDSSIIQEEYFHLYYDKRSDNGYSQMVKNEFIRQINMGRLFDQPELETISLLRDLDKLEVDNIDYEFKNQELSFLKIDIPL